MKHKLVLFMVALLSLELVLAVPMLSIEPTVVTAQPNREFAVNININTDRDVYGTQFDIVYDTTMLSLSSITEGNFLNSRGVNTYTVHKPAHGKSTYAITRTIVRSGISGIGTLATARFLPLRAGQTTVSLSNVKISDPSILPIEGVRTTDSMVGIYTTTPALPPSERRRSSSGGNGGTSRTTPSTTIISAQPDEESEQKTIEQPKKKTEKLILKSAERSEEQPVTEEEINLAKSIFPIVAFIVAALGALAFAYHRYRI